ncbi:hypothetical protein RRG08_010899 [Elysia crispata]|uniref:Uncharacterized protein n=1 Tax=Elysia crispata TaxID=231223 RepID=A0AAE1A1M9_9GAST|nr:hypothetical protein RRG08_010899 [Elysia crispata]
MQSGGHVEASQPVALLQCPGPVNMVVVSVTRRQVLLDKAGTDLGVGDVRPQDSPLCGAETILERGSAGERGREYGELCKRGIVQPPASARI